MIRLPDTTTPSPPVAIDMAVRDAGWLAHRYDPEHDAIHFLPVPRAVHRRATFLTDQYLPVGLSPLIVRRSEAIEQAPRAAPIHFVFHSAFCCSTLVARAFDRPGWAMGLKEPVILNDITGWRRRGGRGADMATVLDDALTLLARPFEPGETIIVKPSNATNILAAAMMTLRPNARAVLLYAPLRTYLGSIARKGMDGRLWVRVLLQGLIDDRLIDLGFSARDYLGLSDLQVAAVGWLAQQALFTSLIETFGTDRIRTLDSETLTGNSAVAITKLASLFGLPLDADELDQILAGPAFTRHSKLDTAFALADRTVELTQGIEPHLLEIDMVAQWVEVVAERMQIAIVPPSPLLVGAPS